MTTEPKRANALGSTEALMGKLSDFLAAENAGRDAAINAMLNLAFNAVMAIPAMWPQYLRGQEVMREMLLERSGGRLSRAAQPGQATDAVGELAQSLASRVPAEAVDQVAALTIELDQWLRRKKPPVQAQLDALLSMYVSLVSAHPEQRPSARAFGDVLHEMFAESPGAAANVDGSSLTH
jgi:hypothetical protein